MTCSLAQRSNNNLAHTTLTCLSTGTPTAINFPFGKNGKLMVFGVPILKHNRVVTDSE